MSECCDPKDRVKELTREEFDAENADLEAFIQTVNQKLKELLEESERQTILFDTYIEQLPNNASLCNHEFAKSIQPMLRANSRVLFFTTMMNAYDEKNNMAKEATIRILSNLNEMTGGSQEAKDLLKGMKKKKSWFF